MTRVGRWMLLGFLIVIGGFAFLVNRAPRPIAQPVVPPTAVPAVPVTPAAAAPAPVAAGGGLVIPVAGIQPGQLVDTWGQARAEGAREHHAIDIMAPRGTPVLAAAAGTIEKLFESKDGGHTIYIRRADPAWIDYYAHLDSYVPDLREGITVRQGQPIGTVGSTGDANPEAPHLHYEIKRMAAGEGWWQGENINPYPILTAGRSQ